MLALAAACWHWEADLAPQLICLGYAAAVDECYAVWGYLAAGLCCLRDAVACVQEVVSCRDKIGGCWVGQTQLQSSDALEPKH